MKKIVRLTENDLTRIVKKVINEQNVELEGNYFGDNDDYYGSFDDNHKVHRNNSKGDTNFDDYDEDSFDTWDDYQKSPYANDKLNNWEFNSKHKRRNFNREADGPENGRYWFDQYQEKSGGQPFKVRKKRRVTESQYKRFIKEQNDEGYLSDDTTMNISGEQMDMLPDLSGHPNGIEVIVAIGCGINTLPPVEHLPQSLIILNLKNNDITEADLEGYAEGLPNLARIALDNNPIAWANEDEIARLEEEGQVLVTL